MSRATVNVVLMVALAAVCGLTVAVREDRSQPNVEFFPNMAHSAPADAFAANHVFADGKTLQQPPLGSVPRGFRALPYQATEEDAAKAGEELTNPISSEDRRDVRRGAELFQSFCSHCHGGGGIGDGEVALHGYPAPPSLLAPEAKDLKDGGIFHIITYGRKNMPPHAIQIDEQDRWRIILHVRAIQAKSDAQAMEAAPAVETAPVEPAAQGS